MTREILFRGKRKDNGKWIEGYLTKCFTGEACRISFWIDVLVCVDTYTFEPYLQELEVIPETVGIKAVDNAYYHDTVDTDAFFEGDILNDEYTITYDEDNAGLYLKSKYGKEHDKLISAITDEKMRLTGNVHENN